MTTRLPDAQLRTSRAADYRPTMTDRVADAVRAARGPGAPWIVAGVATAALSFAQVLSTWGNRSDSFAEGTAAVLTCLILGAAVTIAGRRPGAALVTAWISAGFWVASGQPFLLPQLALGVVAFQCGRRGRTGAVVATVLSTPPAVLLALEVRVGGTLLDQVLPGLTDVGIGGFGSVARILPFVLGLVLVAYVPLVAGVAARLLDRSRRSEAGEAHAREEAAIAYADAETARELARLEESHAQLARDVHDVVGHSLTVVVAQAEAAQYAGDDPETLRGTLRAIASTARSSLADVRRVLSETTDEAGPAGTAGAPVADDPLPGLVEGLRRGGRTVHVHEEGAPRPLPPELATLAHRVTQEMLTNAARHGEAASPIEVERHWDGDELRLEVRNALPVDPSSEDHADLEETRPIGAAAGGRGIDGMRARLTAAGGRLDVRRRSGRGSEAGSFTATAWIPLRPGSPAPEGSGGR